MANLSYLAEIFLSSFEGATCFLPTAYSKIQEKRENLKERLLNKLELQLLDNAQSIHIVKNEELSSGENTKGLAIDYEYESWI